MDKASLSKNNFGPHGWFLIIFSALLFFLQTGVSVDGLNVTVAAFSELRGWEMATLLDYATIGGYFSIVGAIFFGWLIGKRGTRFVMSTCLFLSGLSIIWWGYAPTLSQYLIACALFSTFSNAFSHISTSNLLAVWYPRKKGLAMGWSTMGINLASALFVPMMTVLLVYFGISRSYAILGVVLILLGFIALAFVKNSPEDRGLTPDNEPLTAE